MPLKYDHIKTIKLAERFIRKKIGVGMIRSDLHRDYKKQKLHTNYCRRAKVISDRLENLVIEFQGMLDSNCMGECNKNGNKRIN